jgi:transposase
MLKYKKITMEVSLMKRQSYNSDFKKKVALEAIKERKTLQEIAAEHQIAPSQVTRWKDELIKGAGTLFENTNSKETKRIKELESNKLNLHQKIGQLSVEVDYLKKKLNQLA